MKHTILYLISLISLSGFSQTNTFVIVDAKSNVPVSFAKISSGDYHILSNYEGKFTLDSNHVDFDSIKVSCIGYESASFSMSELEVNSKIELISNSKYLKSVEVVAKKTKYGNTKLGLIEEPVNRLRKDVIRGQTGTIRATWVPNTKPLQGKIETLNIYVSDAGFSSSYFRVHLYSCNEFSIKPSKSLLMSNLVVKGGAGNEWVSIDLKEMYINVPENGFFVGVEWLPETKNEAFLDTVIFNENQKNKTFTYLYEGNGVVLGAVYERYSTSKYKNWCLDSLTNDWAIILPLDESVFFIEDTLENGVVHIPTPDSYYKIVPCINADIRYIKQKSDKTYKAAKSRKLNKVKLVEQDLFKYPQNSIQNLFSSLIKAFEDDNILYVLKYLCVYKKDQFNSIYDDIKSEGIKEIISSKEKQEIIKELTLTLNAIDRGELKGLGDFKYELTVNEFTYNLVINNGQWKINPYSNRIIK
jgi:hypothetical protein